MLGERSVSSRRRGYGEQLLKTRKARHRDRPSGESDDGGGRNRASRGHLCRDRRHAGQLRRPGAAVLPAFSRRRRTIRESWRWLGEHDGCRRPGRTLHRGRTSIDVVAALAEAMPVFAPVKEIAPPADFRIAGQKIPRQPHRYSGRTAISADATVAEAAAAGRCRFAVGVLDGGLRSGSPRRRWSPRFWAPGWNSVQAVTQFQEEVSGPLRGGDSGRRLIEPGRDGDAGLFHAICRQPLRRGRPVAAGAAASHLRLRGAERACAGRRRLSPPPYLAMCAEDAAAAWAWQEGDADRRVSATTSRGDCRCGGCRRCPPASPACRWDCPAAAWLDAAALGKAREGRRAMTDIVQTIILPIVIVVVVLLGVSDAGRGSDLARAAAAGPLAGPLRTEPRRPLRAAASAGRHDQDLQKEDWIPPFADRAVVRAGPG